MTIAGAPRAIGFLAAAVVAVAACAAPAPTTAPTATTSAARPTTAPSGPQAAILGTALNVMTSGATASYTVGNLAPVPIDAQIIAAQGTMYAVDVNIVAQTGTTFFNGFYFVARDQDGASIAPAVGAVKPGITSGQLAPGQTVASHLAFDVPQGKSISQLALRDPQGKTLAIWGVG
ncbi:MAG: DUF1942 domain-containing protein [Mycobacterium sp.]